MSMKEEKSEYDTSSILLIIFVVVTFVTNISIAVGQNFVDWYKKPTLVFVLIGLSMLQNVSYILPALAIRNRTLKIVGVILTSLMVVCLMISTILKSVQMG